MSKRDVLFERGACVKYICAVISVADINAARKFYEDLFGLVVFQDYGRNIAFTCGLALQAFSFYRYDNRRSFRENGRFRGGFDKTSE